MDSFFGRHCIWYIVWYILFTFSFQLKASFVIFWIDKEGENLSIKHPKKGRNTAWCCLKSTDHISFEINYFLFKLVKNVVVPFITLLFILKARIGLLFIPQWISINIWMSPRIVILINFEEIWPKRDLFLKEFQDRFWSQ